MKGDRPDSPFTRSFRLSRMGLGVAGSYLGYQFQNLFFSAGREERKKSFQSKATRRIREELEQLKGPMMKFGQILSMQSQFLNEESVRELSKLQLRAPGMHPTLARSQFKASFGKPPEEVFRQFEPEPFAAASLGQVHRAVTKRGESVVVKIQYPAIRTAIENDFKVLRSALMPGSMTGHIPKGLFAEVERGFLEETDYLNEARNLEWFAKELHPLAYLTVPKVYSELSTDRILTMSHLAGVPLTEFAESKPTQAQKNLVGERLLELFHFQRLGIHAVHADPHAGNYLIDEKGNLGLVDFGCVKRFSKDFVELVDAFVNRAWLHGEKEMERMDRLLWGRGNTGKATQRRAILNAGIVFSNMIYPPGDTGGKLIDFGDRRLLSAYTKMLNDTTFSRLGSSEYAFLVRTELGYYNLLHMLGAKINTTKLLERVRGLTG